MVNGKVYCQRSPHADERVEMTWPYGGDLIGCIACGYTIAPWEADAEFPEPYRSMDGLAQAILDFRPVLVITDERRWTEYPRR